MVQLLAELAPARASLAAGPQLQEAAYRLAARFLCLTSKSPSPVAARLAAARDTGRLTPQEDRTHLRRAVRHSSTQACLPACLPRCFGRTVIGRQAPGPPRA